MEVNLLEKGRLIWEIIPDNLKGWIAFYDVFGSLLIFRKLSINEIAVIIKIMAHPVTSTYNQIVTSCIPANSNMVICSERKK